MSVKTVSAVQLHTQTQIGRTPLANRTSSYNGQTNSIASPMYKPGNYRTKACIFFEQGRCKFGDQCTFSHDLAPEQVERKSTFGAKAVSIVCRYYARGLCEKGSQCVFMHLNASEADDCTRAYTCDAEDVDTDAGTWVETDGDISTPGSVIEAEPSLESSRSSLSPCQLPLPSFSSPLECGLEATVDERALPPHQKYASLFFTSGVHPSAKRPPLPDLSPRSATFQPRRRDSDRKVEFETSSARVRRVPPPPNISPADAEETCPRRLGEKTTLVRPPPVGLDASGLLRTRQWSRPACHIEASIAPDCRWKLAELAREATTASSRAKAFLARSRPGFSLEAQELDKGCSDEETEEEQQRRLEDEEAEVAFDACQLVLPGVETGVAVPLILRGKKRSGKRRASALEIEAEGAAESEGAMPALDTESSTGEEASQAAHAPSALAPTLKLSVARPAPEAIAVGKVALHMERTPLRSQAVSFQPKGIAARFGLPKSATGACFGTSL